MDIRQDTIGQWLTDYNSALNTMRGAGVAIGTDMNGFAPQIPFSSGAVAYPITVAGQTLLPAGFHPPSLNRSQMGAKSYDFQRDGLGAHGATSRSSPS